VDTLLAASGRTLAEHRQLALRYLELLRGRYASRVVSFCLYGSAVRGEAGEGSDVDVLAVVEGLPKNYVERVLETRSLYAELRNCEAYRLLRRSKLAASLSDLLLTPNEVEDHPPILLDIVDEGEILYDRDGFLARVLSDVKLRLAQHGARRLRGRAGSFWILKPGIRPGEVAEI